MSLHFSGTPELPVDGHHNNEQQQFPGSVPGIRDKNVSTSVRRHRLQHVDGRVGAGDQHRVDAHVLLLRSADHHGQHSARRLFPIVQRAHENAQRQGKINRGRI